MSAIAVKSRKCMINWTQWTILSQGKLRPSKADRDEVKITVKSAAQSFRGRAQLLRAERDRKANVFTGTYEPEMQQNGCSATCQRQNGTGLPIK